MPLYLIKDRSDTSAAPRLIRAKTAAQALRHVARDCFDVNAANAEDVASAMTAGARPEEARADDNSLDLPAIPAA